MHNVLFFGLLVRHEISGQNQNGSLCIGLPITPDTHERIALNCRAPSTFLFGESINVAPAILIHDCIIMALHTSTEFYACVTASSG